MGMCKASGMLCAAYKSGSQRTLTRVRANHFCNALLCMQAGAQARPVVRQTRQIHAAVAQHSDSVFVVCAPYQ